MSVTVADFRLHFPEFSDVNTFPDSMVQYWLGIAEKMVRPVAWGNMVDHGIELYAAHHISLEAIANKTATGAPGGDGGIPGLGGIVASKSVGAVSISYDTTTGSEEGAGYWNQTVYGQRFWSLSKMFGAGVIQITGGPAIEPYNGP